MKKAKVFLTKGSAGGITQEAAYCFALDRAGLMNLNLIALSSVLPHDHEIIRRKPGFTYRDFGKKVYAIISEIRSSRSGETICAGLGWLEEDKKKGYGLVVQIQGNDEQKVRKQIKDTLKELAKNGKIRYKKGLNIVTEKITCKSRPVCALVALAFSKAERLL